MVDAIGKLDLGEKKDDAVVAKDTKAMTGSEDVKETCVRVPPCIGLDKADVSLQPHRARRARTNPRRKAARYPHRHHRREERRTHALPVHLNGLLTRCSPQKPSASPSSHPKVHRRISARIGQFMEFGSKKKTGPAAATAVVAQDEKSKDGDSFVSGSADAGAGPVAAGSAMTGGAPLLGEPIKVEPMGDILPAKEVSPDKIRCFETGGLIDVCAGQGSRFQARRWRLASHPRFPMLCSFLLP